MTVLTHIPLKFRDFIFSSSLTGKVASFLKVILRDAVCHLLISLQQAGKRRQSSHLIIDVSAYKMWTQDRTQAKTALCDLLHNFVFYLKMHSSCANGNDQRLSKIFAYTITKLVLFSLGNILSKTVLVKLPLLINDHKDRLLIWLKNH